MPRRQELDVVVFMSSLWADLEHRSTRWREVALRWAQHPRVRRLTVVERPHISMKVKTGVAESPSWVHHIQALEPRIRTDLRFSTPWEGMAHNKVAAVLRDGLRTEWEARRIIVSANPFANPIASRMQSEWGFDAFDDWRANPRNAEWRKTLTYDYWLANKAATVSTNAPLLAESLKSEFGHDPRVVRNGVTRSLYESKAALAALSEQTRSLLPAGDFAVYVGDLSVRVDLDLLLATTQALPLVVAGPSDPATSSRLAAAGVVELGLLAHDQVPGLLASAKVGIVPHLQDAFTASMDPMKVLEYLASGLPVVSTDVPLVKRDGVSVASSADWVATVRAAAAQARRVPKDLLDWDAVAEQLLELHAPS